MVIEEHNLNELLGNSKRSLFIMDTVQTNEGINVMDQATNQVLESTQQAINQSDQTEPQVEDIETVVEPVTDGGTTQLMNLFDYLVSNSTKFQNVELFDISAFSSIPRGVHVLFKTKHQSDARMMLFDDPHQLWLDSVEAISIRVEKSGIIIHTGCYKYYVGKSNIVRFTVTNDKVVSMDIISKSKTIDGVKIEPISVESRDATSEEVKLYVKSVSIRLYPLIKDLTNLSEIKDKIMGAMGKIKDINHLIKLDKDLLLTCRL